MATKAPEVWSELDDRLVTDSQGRVKKAVNIDSVYSSIRNIVGTLPGERVMLPEFASNLKDLVFEPITDRLIDFISKQVKDTIERWDDRPVVLGVDIKTDPDRNKVDLIVSFRLRGADDIYQVSTRVV